MIQKIKDNKIVTKILEFIESDWFIIPLSLVILLSNFAGLDIFIFAILVLTVAFVNIFSNRTNGMVPILLLGVFTVSYKNTPAADHGNQNYYTSTPIIIAIVILAVILISSCVFHILYYKKGKAFFNTVSIKNKVGFGILIMCVVMMFNGAFSKYYNINNIIVGLTQFVSFAVVYMYLASTAEWDKNSLKRISKIGAAAILVIVLEILFIYIMRYEWGNPLDNAWKGQLITGWGISNVFGIFLVMLIPLCFYLTSRDEKFGFLYYTIAAIGTVGIYFTLCRSALLVAVPLFVVGTIYSLIKSNKMHKILILVSALAVAAVFVLLLLSFEELEHSIKFFIDAMFKDRGRFDIWKRDIELFKEYPIFGAGFASTPNAADNLFGKLSHNTFFALLGHNGIVGLAAFGYHIYTLAVLWFKKPTTGKTFAFLVIVCYHITGMFDNSFFYLMMTFFSMVCIIVAQNDNKSAVVEEVTLIEGNDDITKDVDTN